MPWIKMKTLKAGPQGVWPRESKQHLPNAQAADLVAGGWATYTTAPNVKVKEPEKPKAPEPETAMEEPSENAVKKRGRPRKSLTPFGNN